MMAGSGRITAILALYIAVLNACSNQSAENSGAGSFKRHTIKHKGLEREYFVYLPQGDDDGAKYLVVFFLHGYGGSATGTEAETTNGLNLYAEKNGYIKEHLQHRVAYVLPLANIARAHEIIEQDDCRGCVLVTLE